MSLFSLKSGPHPVSWDGGGVVSVGNSAAWSNLRFVMVCPDTAAGSQASWSSPRAAMICSALNSPACCHSGCPSCPFCPADAAVRLDISRTGSVSSPSSGSGRRQGAMALR